MTPTDKDWLSDIMGDLYVSTHGGSTLEEDGKSNEPDVIDFNEARAAIEAHITTHYVPKGEVERRIADERNKARQLYAKRNPQYTRQWIADALGISRPTLAKWIDNPELFTIGAIRKLAALPTKEET